MLIRNKKLSVIPITTHIDVKQISRKISLRKIINKVKTAEFWFKYHFNRKPKIGILGLNPHNAEFRKIQKKIKLLFLQLKNLKF